MTVKNEIILFPIDTCPRVDKNVLLHDEQTGQTVVGYWGQAPKLYSPCDCKDDPKTFCWRVRDDGAPFDMGREATHWGPFQLVYRGWG